MIQQAKNAVQNKYRQTQSKLTNVYEKIVSKGSRLIRYANQKYTEKKQQFTDLFLMCQEERNRLG